MSVGVLDNDLGIIDSQPWELCAVQHMLGWPQPRSLQHQDQTEVEGTVTTSAASLANTNDCQPEIIPAPISQGSLPAPAWRTINPGFSHRHNLRGFNKLK